MKWVASQSLSLEKEKAKRVMIYYATPEGKPEGGYFSSTLQRVRDDWIKARGGSEHQG